MIYFYSSGFAGAIFLNLVFISRQFTLGKNERLKSRKIIEQLFREGKNFSLFPFRIYYLHHKSFTIHHSPFTVQFGVGASSKNFKKAVDRNRIKRLMKEAYRLQKTNLNNLLKERNQQVSVFVIYTGKELPEYKMVFEKMGVILQRLINVVSEKNSSNT
ncbi:MAG TPA: ribonuclease P protein component [Puia sp.]|nr:ribonuclease P protein component [Puia sp.]